jgi:transposase
VKELRQQGYTQEQIAERIGMDAETVARWLHAPEFPERQIRSDRRRDQSHINRLKTIKRQMYGRVGSPVGLSGRRLRKTSTEIEEEPVQLLRDSCRR